ncbi:CRISPR-associated protein Csm1 [Caldanaerobius fijiensis DSM 17918]|uniref:CRISPR system single-strand-specific deoxyribonuclease Cas10/Csm1 (subtype III-A) n=1 Tax=Caldanaerobius fijiensis DSM 17918 TaxID=1121256 RepID=A0A1M4SM30_9THEO|nr:type III-A CRISPR-associated protein Cas10/Csm1 [Caldanaerobius fijiensis]SHE33324.1 CRISPR-associated protein Csm1 [Caldanaerobius fijiensis DSM 17918]
MGLIYENFTEEERNLFLASILHDIGKYWQRTRDDKTNEKVKKVYREIYREEGSYNPRHQEWGAYFCETYVKINEVTLAVRNHHRPVTKMDYIIAIADKLSAVERDNKRSDDEEDAKQLISIFSDIKLDGLGAEGAYYKKLVPLSEFTMSTPEIDMNISYSYKLLWERFIDDFVKIENFSDPIELLKFYHVLEEYTFNVPSAYYYSRPDISLWAHLKTTAAIAFCLFRELEGSSERVYERIHSKIITQSVFEDGEGDLFCLVKGDISGIQDFVYDTEMDGATKSLRGKSFYISYLMDLVAKYILINEKMPICNMIYSGGGHFYLLMPAKFIDKIDYYQGILDQILFNAHGLRLSILIDAVPVSIEDLIKNFSDKLDEVGIKINKKKEKKYLSLIFNNNFKFFEPYEDKGDICPHCGRPLISDRCDFCFSFEKLGESLIKGSYIVEQIIKPLESSIRTYDDIFKALGFKIEISKEPRDGFCYAYKKDVFKFRNCCGYIRIPSHMKEEGGKIVNFDEISDMSKGCKTWGIVRGDVDNLGRIFYEGLGENKSIARVSTLSSELSLFFGSYLESLLKDEFEYCSAIYAGGDDFLFVGPWDKLPYLAYAIRNKFSEFTGHNSAITISMSIDISPDRKFPLYKVALSCGEHLEDAKLYVRSGKQKDCLAFAGYNLGWEEFEKLSRVKSMFVSALEKGVSRAILSIIYKVDDQKKMAERNGEIFKSWWLIYHIARLGDRYKNAKDIVNEIKDALLEKGNLLYKHTYLACRWAEMETRNE